MSQNFWEESSIQLMYFQKSETKILWKIFGLETSKNCDLYVVYMLSFCKLNKSFFTQGWISEVL